jgi:hypothetical protein
MFQSHMVTSLQHYVLLTLKIEIYYLLRSQILCSGSSVVRRAPPLPKKVPMADLESLCLKLQFYYAITFLHYFYQCLLQIHYCIIAPFHWVELNYTINTTGCYNISFIRKNISEYPHYQPNTSQDVGTDKIAISANSLVFFALSLISLTVKIQFVLSISILRGFGELCKTC